MKTFFLFRNGFGKRNLYECNSKFIGKQKLSSPTSPDARYTLMNSSVLHILNTSKANEGRYACVANNGLRSWQSNKFHLRVHEGTFRGVGNPPYLWANFDCRSAEKVIFLCSSAVLHLSILARLLI